MELAIGIVIALVLLVVALAIVLNRRGRAGHQGDPQANLSMKDISRANRERPSNDTTLY